MPVSDWIFLQYLVFACLHFTGGRKWKIYFKLFTFFFFIIITFFNPLNNFKFLRVNWNVSFLVIPFDYLRISDYFQQAFTNHQYLTEKRRRKSRKSIILRFDFEREAGFTALEIRLREFIGSLTSPKPRVVPARIHRKRTQLNRLRASVSTS